MTTTQNDVIERMVEWLDDRTLNSQFDDDDCGFWQRQFRLALAAERRATVERIREQWGESWGAGPTSTLQRILDEEAAR